jgi:hypothetical protein
MSSPNRRNNSKDTYVDLDTEDFLLLAEQVQDYAHKGQLEGIVATDTEIKTLYLVSGAVNEGGYRSMPWLADKVGNALTSNHSFDIIVTESIIQGEEKDAEAALRVYNDSGYDFHVEKVSSDEYIPFWGADDAAAPEAESPDNDHPKLTFADVKAILWCLTHTGEQKDSGMLADKYEAEDAAILAIQASEASGHTYKHEETFSTDGYNIQEDDPDNAIPGSSLTITRVQNKLSESDLENYTDYSLTTKHLDAAEGPDGSEIWIWVIYNFHIKIDAKGDIQEPTATVDIAFKRIEEELFLPPYWVEYQRQKQQNNIRHEFPGIMKDALDDLFTTRI